MMPSPKKFNFNAPLDDLSFQERLHYASTGQIQKIEDLNPTFTQDDIEQFIISAKREALKDAQNAVELQSVDVLKQMVISLNALYEQHQSLEEQFYENALGFMASFLQKLFPKLAEMNAFQELEQDLTDKLKAVLQKPKLLITLHPDLLANLEPKMRTLMTEYGYEGKFTCRTDASFGHLDFQIHWEEGGIERNTQRLMEELDKIARPFLEKIETRSLENQEFNRDQIGV